MQVLAVLADNQAATALVISLLIQAVAYGKLINKVDTIEKILIGKDGDGGVVKDVRTLQIDVAILKGE
jgi:hypothetical protein